MTRHLPRLILVWVTALATFVPPGLPAPLAQAEVVDGDFREMEATGPRLRWMRDTRSKLRQRINEDTAHHEEEL